MKNLRFADNDKKKIALKKRRQYKTGRLCLLYKKLERFEKKKKIMYNILFVLRFLMALQKFKFFFANSCRTT